MRTIRGSSDANDSRIGGLRAGRAVRYPLCQGFPFGTFDLEAVAAFVRHRARRLQKHERTRRLGEIHAPAEGCPRQREPVALVIVAAKREPETALTRGGPMTRPRGTSRLRENRLHVIAERDRFRGGVRVQEQQQE
jgi:hypothetical protein